MAEDHVLRHREKRNEPQPLIDDTDTKVPVVIKSGYVYALGDKP